MYDRGSGQVSEVSIRGLLYQLETELEQELPVRLRQSLPGRGPFIRRNVRIAQLAMRRHHAYRRSIMTGYGAVALWIPVFRCRECRRMSGGADVLGAVFRVNGQARSLASLPGRR